jgi:uncharacterized membrane protein HdeD (DUF308 family)
MNAESAELSGGQAPQNTACAAAQEQLQQEFKHLRSSWLWLFLLGILLAVCGTAALTMVTSFAVMVVLGVALMVAGVATLVAALWQGKWSGMLVQLLVGILYLVAGFVVTDKPMEAALAMTLFLAALFIVVGAFRTVAALTIRFPHWGWALLNGVVTLLCGLVIYRHFPQAGLWVIGLLVGIEMLFHGWTWIMLSLAIRKIPAGVAGSQAQ